MADRPLPDAGFLTRTDLRSWTTWIPWLDSVRSHETWFHPIVAAAVPTPPIDRLERLHSKVAFLFDRLQALPQTLSHLDAWRANLIGARALTGEDRTVAIDWSFVGIAPVGQEVAILVGGSHIWLDAEPDQLATMSKRVRRVRPRPSRRCMARQRASCAFRTRRRPRSTWCRPFPSGLHASPIPRVGTA